MNLDRMYQQTLFNDQQDCKMKYTFAASERDNETTVIASNEWQARHECMVARWGLPTGYGYDTYQGKGLNLVKVVENFEEQ